MAGTVLGTTGVTIKKRKEPYLILKPCKVVLEQALGGKEIQVREVWSYI